MMAWVTLLTQPGYVVGVEALQSPCAPWRAAIRWW